jgi:uncharacterized protein (DUF1697 family)
VLQSGNLIFQAERKSGLALERLLEKETAQRLGVAADYLVRNASELEAIIDRNPFRKEAEDDPSHLLVMFLKAAPAMDELEALRSSIQGPEYLHCEVYPAGIGRSKLTGTLIEQKLGRRGTARNWNTILKVFALCK